MNRKQSAVAHLSVLVPSGIFALVGLAATAAQADTPKTFPAVIPLFSEVYFEGKIQGIGRCTGTFIHPRLLLTAAHCLRDFKAMIVNGTVERATDMRGNPVKDPTADPSQVYILSKKWWGNKPLHPVRVHVSDQAMPVERGGVNLDSVNQDLAILEFAQDSSPNVLEVSQRAPQIDDTVYMTGYGVHGSSRSLHSGQNKLISTDDDMLVTSGSPLACTQPSSLIENDWSICPGDSGGPLIDAVTGKVLGVASTSGAVGTRGAGKRLMSTYVDITKGAGADFVQSVIHSLR